MLGLETAHSPNAQDITTITWVLLAISAIIVIAVNVGLLMYVMRFRARRGREPARFRGRPAVHARAAGAFFVAALAIFVAGVVYNEKATGTPDSPEGSEPVLIRAVGQQWIWRYEYPMQQNTEGSPQQSPVTTGPTFNDVFSYYELVVPVDTVVNVDLESTDVVHRWWVPALGGKYQAIPGHTASFSFRAEDEGSYDGASTAFSGPGYATMRTRVRVVSREEYETFIGEQAAEIKAAQVNVQKQQSAGGPPGITASEAATEGTGQ